MPEIKTPYPPMPPYQYMPPRKSRWWIPVVIVLGILAVIFICIGLFVSSITSSFETKPVSVASNSVLQINLSMTVPEYNSSPNPLATIMTGKKQTTLRDVLAAIKRAKTDNRIKGIYIKGSIAQIGFSKCEEILTALADFKLSGKFIYSYIPYGREIEYYMAIKSDKIFASPEAIIEMNGFGVSSVFLKGLFDKIGMNYHVIGFEDFKSAGESYSRKNFSDSAKYQLRQIVNQRYDHFASAVCTARGIQRKDLDAILDRGVYTADTLLKLGFLDSLMYESSVKDFIKEKVTGSATAKDKDVSYLSVGAYLSDPNPPTQTVASADKKIAIIYAVGPLVEKITTSPFTSESVITAPEFCKSLKQAREDKDVKLIIIRVDSPGGSVMTSDEIYQEILKTKLVKPVYASMSDVAASGGYYISAPCDTIIASPSTITGSIGVIMAIPDAAELMGKLGISADTISSGRASQFGNGMYPMSKADYDQFHSLGKSIYDRFINKVALNRKKTYDEVRAIAKGRVWTGAQAKEIGLVDVLGGMETAIAMAKKRIGIPEGTLVHVSEYPKKGDKISDILKMFNESEDSEEVSLIGLLAGYYGIGKSDMQKLYESMPLVLRSQIRQTLLINETARREKAVMAMPLAIEIE